MRVPDADAGTDVGSLKGIIMSRGDWVANYTDIPVAPEVPGRPARADFTTDAEYNQAVADYQADYNNYQTEYAEFSKERDYYNTYLEPYTVNNIIAQFDQLVHGVVTKINDVLCPNKEIELADGSKMTVLDWEKAGYGMGDNNQIQGTELFIRNTMPRYKDEILVTLADGTTQKVRELNAEAEDNYHSMYTLGNIQVNDELIKNPSLLPLTNLQNEELQGVADQLIQIWNDDFTTLGPNSLVTNNFMGYYSEFIADFANKGKTYNGIAESQQKSVNELENQRQVLVGVSTDEELSNMIKFQQGFNAASRYFTVVSEMVEHLINKLG